MSASLKATATHIAATHTASDAAVFTKLAAKALPPLFLIMKVQTMELSIAQKDWITTRIHGLAQYTEDRKCDLMYPLIQDPE